MSLRLASRANVSVRYSYSAICTFLRDRGSVFHMNADPRAALEALTLAFERHLEACSARRGDDDPAVIAASDALADAFETYDDALLNAFNEMTPLVLLDDDDFDDDDFDDDDFDDDFDDEDDDDLDDADDETSGDEKHRSARGRG